jgi:hydroxymethylbilane synthase
VGTGSPRRSAQLLERRPDLKVVPLRGNVGTRLKKLSEQAELDAVVLAAAGLERLNIRVAPSGLLQGEDVPPGLAATPLSLSEMLPCVGQAALGIEIRAHDQRMASLCEKIDHAPTHRCVAAERAFLKAMGGGCHLSVAAYAELDGEELRLRAVSFLNEKARRGEIRGGANEAEQLGQRLAAELKK